MYRQQFFPRLGDYIDTLLKVTKLTKSIVCVTGGMGGSTNRNAATIWSV